ncbi:MAG: hypothetical protein ACE5NW_07245 [Acidiferrobacterales bacterium]
MTADQRRSARDVLGFDPEVYDDPSDFVDRALDQMVESEAMEPGSSGLRIESIDGPQEVRGLSSSDLKVFEGDK